MAFWKPFSKNNFKKFWSIEICTTALTIYLDRNPDSDQLFWKVFRDFFLWFLRFRIYPLTYTHKNRVLGGCFWNDLQFVYIIEALMPLISNGPNWAVDFRANGRGVLSRFVPHLYAWKRRFVGMVLKKIHSMFTESAPSKKHPLPIPIKLAFWAPCWKQCLPFVYRKPILQIILSPNSHRKLTPLLKNIPHLYEKNRGFYTPFWGLSTTYLQFVYKNRPCERKLRHGPLQDLKMRSCLLP